MILVISNFQKTITSHSIVQLEDSVPTNFNEGRFGLAKTSKFYEEIFTKVHFRQFFYNLLKIN